MSKSHILFTSECQIKTVEERQKKPRNNTDTPESYWTIKDHNDTVYLAYHRQQRQVEMLIDLLPENPNQMTPPLKIEGYVSTSGRGLFLCLLKVLEWDNAAKDYRPLARNVYRETPSVPPSSPGPSASPIPPPVLDDIDELEREYLRQWEPEKLQAGA